MADEMEANNTEAQPATPPVPVETENAPQDNQLPMEDAGQAPMAERNPPPQTTLQVPDVKPPDSLAVKVYHGIMGALGGTQDTTYAIDPTTRKLVATSTPSGPGTQWKRMIAGVIQGTAAGLGTAPGPGQLARAAGAGINAGTQMVQKQDDAARQQAGEDFDRDQKTTMMKAQTQALTVQGATLAFNLSRLKVQARQQDAEMENSFAKMIRDGGDGSQDLGVAQTFGDVIQMHKDMPGLLTQNAHGNVIQVAHVNADGVFDGNRFALVTPEWKDAKLPTDQSFYQLGPPSKLGEKPPIEKMTVKAGSTTNGEFANAQAAARNEILKFYDEDRKQSDTEKLQGSEITKNNASAVQSLASANKDNADAHKTALEAAGIVHANDGMSDAEIVKGMLDSTVDIRQVTGLRGNNRAAYIKAAKTADPNWNMTDYTAALDAKAKTAKAFASDGKQGQQIQSFNTFLGHALDYSQSVSALRNSNLPLLNKPINWLKKNAAGNPVVSQMVIEQEAVKTEFQNFLNNNHALLAQDKEQGEKMLDNDMSPAQQQGAIKQFVATAAVRMSGVNHAYYTQFHRDAPDMLDEDGKAALAHFGVPESMVYHHPTGVAPSPQPTGVAPPKSAPAGSLAGAIQPGEHISSGPKGQVVWRGGQWVNPATGQAVQ
jgi:hypothetical protein